MEKVTLTIPDNLPDNVKNFAIIANKAIGLYQAKNHDYGNSFDKGMDVIGSFYGIGRIYDKVNRLINLSKLENIQVTHEVDESIEDTLMDLACYSIMLLKYRYSKKLESIDNIDYESSDNQ